jgi:hypothetical protein
MEGLHVQPPAALRRYCRSRLFVLFLAGLLAAGGLTACSSGGGGNSGAAPAASALEMPSRITMTSTGDAAPAAASVFRAARSGLYRAPSAYTDPGTDYMAEPKQSWAVDTEELDLINDILGVVQQSGYQNFLNAGPYKALVKKVGQSEQSQGGSSATATTSEELMEIILDVSRASDSDPMIIKVWVREEDGPGGAVMLIRGYFSVTQGVSAQYPFGAMEAHFKGNLLDANGAEGDEVMTLALSIGADADGRVIVQFLDQGSEPDAPCVNLWWDFRGRIVADSTLANGKAYIYANETDCATGIPEEETVYFAYNADYFKFQALGSLDVTTQDKHNLRHRIYKYKVFDHDTGAKVTRNSGFGIRLADGQYGYVGYYGLWTPYGVTASAGDTVTRADNGQQYTLVNVGGKLTKHTRASLQLSALNGVEISVWDQGSDIIVTWSATEETFKKIGTRNNQTGQIDYLDPSGYVEHQFSNSNSSGWCEALRAQLSLGNLTPANGDTVYYHIQETVSGTLTENLTLYYWGFAMAEPVTQAALITAEADYAAYFMGPPIPKTYTFDAAANILRDEEGNAIILGADLVLTGTKYAGGYYLYPMTTDDSYNAGNCGSIQDAEVYYTWTTGPNQWNKFTTVRDASGALVAFDRPLSFSYVHSTANDANGDATHDGRTFRLEWDGSDLQMPWVFDAATGEWSPTITLKDGTVLTDGDGHPYVVKGVEEALLMAEAADPSLADGLVIDTTVAPPDLAYDESKTALVGAVPTGVELKVIKGELVD